MANNLEWIVEAAVAERRSRSSWNDRLTHWERPPSDHEETKIQRAATIATKLVQDNERLIEIGVTIRPQGSYYNNTNVRLEADMDLRVQIPTYMVRYDDGVVSSVADVALGYVVVDGSMPETATEVRDLLAADCQVKFGVDSVKIGNKAVSVDGLDGSRADVDLVPAFHLRYVIEDTPGNFRTLDGVGIIGKDGSETWNFPEQHHANGITKQKNTAFRFKKLARSLKKLNYELCDLGAITKRLPSFMVECLVYLVEDEHFLVETDERYDRFCRVVDRLQLLLEDDDIAKGALEVNDIKILFHDNQAWTLTDARNFLAAASTRLHA
jgi:hypothetical protein